MLPEPSALNSLSGIVPWRGDDADLTAIVVLYHSDHLLGGLIENLARLFPHLPELILVDNAGSSTFDPVGDSRIKRVKAERNLGYGGAINLGLRHATHEQILILNPDITFIQANLWLLGGPFLSFGTREGCSQAFAAPTPWRDLAFLTLRKLGGPFGFIETWRLRQLPREGPLQVISWLNGSVIHTTRSTLAALGGFDEGFFLFYEEVDLAMRAREAGIPVVAARELVYRELPGKSSSGDVSEVKVRAEVGSFCRFHRLHGGRIRAVALGTGLVAFWALAWLGLLPAGLLGPKFRRKRRESAWRCSEAWLALTHPFAGWGWHS